jgi:hypothetical protein
MSFQAGLRNAPIAGSKNKPLIHKENPPSPMLGNGGWFINRRLFDCCIQNNIKFRKKAVYYENYRICSF